MCVCGLTRIFQEKEILGCDDLAIPLPISVSKIVEDTFCVNKNLFLSSGPPRFCHNLLTCITNLWIYFLTKKLFFHLVTCFVD